jgi:hypothetical protein
MRARQGSALTVQFLHDIVDILEAGDPPLQLAAPQQLRWPFSRYCILT